MEIKIITNLLIIICTGLERMILAPHQISAHIISIVFFIKTDTERGQPLQEIM